METRDIYEMRVKADAKAIDELYRGMEFAQPTAWDEGTFSVIEDVDGFGAEQLQDILDQIQEANQCDSPLYQRLAKVNELCLKFEIIKDFLLGLESYIRDAKTYMETDQHGTEKLYFDAVRRMLK
jgi:hypothetical protein